jgi:type II secretory pathway component PulF
VIILPAQLTQRSEFYHQLAQLTGAGLGLIRALEQLRLHPPSLSYREPIRRVLHELNQGSTFAEALSRTDRWLPDFDITLVEAGEKSGRLDQSFRLLSEHYSERARMARQMMADLAYPAFLLHFAVFILPFPQLFATGDWLHYGRQVFAVLLPVYLALAAVIYALQSGHGEGWRARVEAVLGGLPVLGTARRFLALARLAAALEALISAGVTIIEAWELAAAASGSPALRRAVRAWKPLLLAGQTPAETVLASADFPALFRNQYHTGEISGKLDDTLRRLHGYYQDEGSRKMHAVAKWVPIFVYLVIAFVIAFKIISFYLGYFQTLSNVKRF